MLNYGKTITALRKQRGMTQAELGSALNVTYQAVSKWENDLSQPSIDVLADICKIFGITMDEFIKMAGGSQTEETAVTVSNGSALTGEETAAIVREELNKIERQKQQAIIDAQKKEEAKKRAYEAELERQEKVGLRVGFGISLGVAVTLFVLIMLTGEWLAALVILYATFAFGMHLGHDCFIEDFFIGSWGASINMPGVIFSLDVNGILFFLAYKCLIAPLASFLIGLVVGIGGTILAILMAMVSFPIKAYWLFKETF